MQGDISLRKAVFSGTFCHFLNWCWIMVFGIEFWCAKKRQNSSPPGKHWFYSFPEFWWVLVIFPESPKLIPINNCRNHWKHYVHEFWRVLVELWWVLDRFWCFSENLWKHCLAEFWRVLVLSTKTKIALNGACDYNKINLTQLTKHKWINVQFHSFYWLCNGRFHFTFQFKTNSETNSKSNCRLNLELEVQKSIRGT